ncbi:MAG: hypothetical protein ACI86H_002734 [bacterium]|jgi:hypothetical protein
MNSQKRLKIDIFFVNFKSNKSLLVRTFKNKKGMAIKFNKTIITHLPIPPQPI